MNDTRFDLLAHGVRASQGRRFALKSFGLAALAATAATPLVAEAGNNGKNKPRKNKKRKRKQSRNEQECPPEDCTREAQQAMAVTCQAQATQCEQEVRGSCDRQSKDDAAEQECLNELLPCCASLGTCNITAFFTCIAPPPIPN